MSDAGSVGAANWQPPAPRLIGYGALLLSLFVLLRYLVPETGKVNAGALVAVSGVTVSLSGVIGVMGLTYYRSFKARSLLFVSLGFIGAGLLDVAYLVHRMDGFEFATRLPHGAASGWDSSGAQLYLGLMLLAGWRAAYGKIHPIPAHALRDSTIYLLAASLWLACYGVSRIPASSPDWSSPGGGATATAILAGMTYAGVLVIFLMRSDWRHYRLQHGFVLALIILSVVQVAYVPMAVVEGRLLLAGEFLRLVAYLLVFSALLTGTASMFRQASSLQLERRVSNLMGRLREQAAADGEGLGAMADVRGVTHAGTFELDLISGKFTGNQATHALFGAHARIHDLESFGRVLHPDDRPRLAHALARAEAEGELFRQECRVSIGDGCRWLRAVAGIESVDGVPVRLLGYLEDITDRKRVELEKDELFRDLDQIVTAVDRHALTATLDLEGRIVTANRNFHVFCGADESTAIGREFGRFVTLSPAHPNLLLAGLASASIEAWSGQIQASSSEGRARTAAGSITAHRDVRGQPDSCIFLGFDITDRIEAEAALEASVEAHRNSNEDLQLFAHIVSHDLQEPLRMVSSFMTLLDRRYSEELPSEAREFIQFALEGSTRMRNLLDGLLEYSRVQSQALEFEEVPLEVPLADARANLAMLERESDASIEVESLPTVQCDRSQMMQVFQNLLSNAIKFHGADRPRIRIASRQEAGRWIVTVQDNGIGIEPAHFQRIFMIFQRLHGREEYPGTGVGLAVCARIMERHGGRMNVTSEPGEGSCFSLCF